MAKLSELEIYTLALEIGNDVYKMTHKLEWFDKSTIGVQFVKSADSIAANISEGFGRYYYKENKLFCYYARGSLLEKHTWSLKAHQRNIITKEEYDHLNKKLEILHIKLNSYIKTIGKK